MDQDQISHLPKTILHEILSRLPYKDATRTSVLSKAWAETWSTFPILSFSDAKIIGTSPQAVGDSVSKRKYFLNYVRQTLLRFHDQRLAIKEFQLRMECLDLWDVSQDVDLWQDLDLWMKLARESGVEVLMLCLTLVSKKYKEGKDQCYIFPKSVLEAKSLKKLALTGRVRVDQAFLYHSIKFFSLREVSLWHLVLEDEKTIEHFISHCPLLEYITLVCCHVWKPGGMRRPLSRISMHGLPKLKGVVITRIQEVYIDAPNLEKLCHWPSDYHAPCKMDFDRCRNLRDLSLCCLPGTIITNKWFLELFTKFPFLESLKLVKCTMSEKINISSGQLKVLALSYCSNLEEVNIDALNLLACKYSGRGTSKPIISFLRSSSHLEVYFHINIGAMDLCNLRELIQNLKPQNVLTWLSLSIFHPVMDAWNSDVLQLSSPPPSIKHLDLNAVPKNETFHLPIVNRLLSSCRPATISLSLHPLHCSRAFIELFYETLMDRKEEDCFCSSRHIKCWLHDLKNVKVTSSIKTEDVDFKTMLDALTTSTNVEKISFMLEF